MYSANLFDTSRISVVDGQSQGYVGNDTDTLVVICTSEILSRPWCVGEMTTARLHGVDTILVVLPDFTWPTEDFITLYASHVPGVYGLAKFGISVSMAQVTLAWLSTKSQISLPNKLSLSVSDAVAGKLVSRKRGQCEFSPQHGVDTTRVASTVRERPTNIHKMVFQRALSNLRGGPGQTRANHIVQQVMDPAVMPTCKVVAIVDRGNWDGVCVALLVKEMLVSHLLTAVEHIPYVLTEEDSLPPETEIALIICTNGCFHSASLLRQVLEAKETGVHFVPVVAEENFHFPTETFYEEVRERAPIVLKSQNDRYTQEDLIKENLVTAIENIFLEIAIDVALQDSEDIIAVRIGVIAGRVLQTRSNRQRASLEAGIDHGMGSLGVLISSSSTGSADQSRHPSALVETTTVVDLDSVHACSAIHDATPSVGTFVVPPGEPWEGDTDI